MHGACGVRLTVRLSTMSYTKSGMDYFTTTSFDTRKVTAYYYWTLLYDDLRILLQYNSTYADTVDWVSWLTFCPRLTAQNVLWKWLVGSEKTDLSVLVKLYTTRCTNGLKYASKCFERRDSNSKSAAFLCIKNGHELHWTKLTSSIVLYVKQPSNLRAGKKLCSHTRVPIGLHRGPPSNLCFRLFWFWCSLANFRRRFNQGS